MFFNFSLLPIIGLVKAALTNPSTSKPGDFRATFEAQIRKADIVFLRTFFAVELPKYYNPVLNRLLPIVGEKDTTTTGWRLLRTLGELKWEAGIKTESNPDSQYKVSVGSVNKFYLFFVLRYTTYLLFSS